MPPNRLAQLQHLLTDDPGDSFLLYALAMEQAKLGDVAGALTSFDRCIQADPSHCYAYYHKAKTLAGAGRGPEAIETARAGHALARSLRNDKAMSELAALIDELT